MIFAKCGHIIFGKKKTIIIFPILYIFKWSLQNVVILFLVKKLQSLFFQF